MLPQVSLTLGPRRRAALVVAGWAACALWTGVAGGQSVQPPAPKENAAAADCRTFRVRQQDEIWAVSTRCLGCPSGDLAQPRWSVWRYNAQLPSWENASAAEFYATDLPDVTTAAYLHGNQIGQNLSLADGLEVYFQLAGKLDDAPPVRFVIWSWPSDKIRGPLRDVRSKACRTDSEAYYLARFLAGMDPRVSAGLIGYSYGARIVAGGLHLLGGGNLAGQAVAAAARPNLRVAFWVAAEHDDWLLPGRYHGQALPVADRWFITNNVCDPVLRRYRFVEKCSNPVALGYSGLVGRNLLSEEQNRRIEEMNVVHLVDDSHEMPRYLYSTPIIERTREIVLWPQHVPAAAGQELAAATGK
ncbi:MAG: hypothetical protein WD872_14340 [Pirellulaceae bacterium]